MKSRAPFSISSALTLLLAMMLSACGQESVDEPTVVAEPESEVNAAPVAVPRTPSPDGAAVYFITPASGATLSNPISIEFGINGMDVVKAGDNQANSGHHHLLIDTDLPALGFPIPKDDHNIHFGDGSTATEITLEPGEHTLQLLLGDYLHIPHNPPVVSIPVMITVE